MAEPVQAQPVYVRGGPFPWRLLFLVVAVVAFVIAALIAFGVFLKGNNQAIDAIGWFSVGSACFAVAHI